MRCGSGGPLLLLIGLRPDGIEVDGRIAMRRITDISLPIHHNRQNHEIVTRIAGDTWNDDGQSRGRATIAHLHGDLPGFAELVDANEEIKARGMGIGQAEATGTGIGGFEDEPPRDAGLIKASVCSRLNSVIKIAGTIASFSIFCRKQSIKSRACAFVTSELYPQTSCKSVCRDTAGWPAR